MTLRIPPTLAVLFALASPALAQSPAETGTGGSADTTVRAPNTTAVGRTKPPGSALGPATAEQREDRQQIEKRNDSIETGICIGCNK